MTSPTAGILTDMKSQSSDAAGDISQAQRLRGIITGSIGNLIEWYNFYIYAYFSLYFAPAFFPESDRTVQLLSVAAIYAAGFLIRPLGGWFFGRYADRRGRKASMVSAILLMGAGSLLIGVLPTYATAGALAPALLLLMRLAQGFSMGGMYGTAATYLGEVAVARHRGFYASFQAVTMIGGQLLALLTLVLIQLALSDEAIHGWAWRAPFMLAAALALVVVLLRHHMHETFDEQKAATREAGSLRSLIRHPTALFTVVAITAGGAMCFYTFTTYMQKYLVNTAGMNVRTVSLIMVVALIFYMLMMPVIGNLSDRIGRRKCLLIFTSLMTVCVVPILTLMENVQHPLMALVLMMSALAILSFYTSISGLFKAELFPVHVRALGVGLTHSLAAAIFGGSAEFVGLLFRQTGFEQGLYWYVAVLCAAAFMTALWMKEPTRADMRT